MAPVEIVKEQPYVPRCNLAMVTWKLFSNLACDSATTHLCPRLSLWDPYQKIELSRDSYFSQDTAWNACVKELEANSW
jgi:hypothetical protein